MIPDRCSFCKGKLVDGKHEFVVKVTGTMLAIKDVVSFQLWHGSYIDAIFKGELFCE